MLFAGHEDQCHRGVEESEWRWRTPDAGVSIARRGSLATGSSVAFVFSFRLSTRWGGGWSDCFCCVSWRGPPVIFRVSNRYYWRGVMKLKMVRRSWRPDGASLGGKAYGLGWDNTCFAANVPLSSSAVLTKLRSSRKPSLQLPWQRRQLPDV